MYIYIYVFHVIHMCTYVYIYIYLVFYSYTPQFIVHVYNIILLHEVEANFELLATYCATFCKEVPLFRLHQDF